LISYDRLFKKPLLFRSFAGLTVQEFDDIYNKEIVKRYGKHMKLSVYQKERKESDLLVQVDLSNLILKTDF